MGAGDTFTPALNSGSVMQPHDRRFGETRRIRPTRPAGVMTAMPTWMPLFEPWLISTVCCSKF